MHDQTLEQAAREAMIILGDTQNLTAHGPGQPAPEQGGGLDDLQRHPAASAILWLQSPCQAQCPLGKEVPVHCLKLPFCPLCAWKLIPRGCAPIS